ncbi:hydroxyisourate hydrolase [Bacillus sp. Marseille-P3800]|uniref:hydroxyisourate hydrolase n=1 Tax=Bacillus sp. Marseille-P3800 TaxID=2014782 RepID=UPI000C086324|nr:hydroxyisourate hydrolase [Bacillus sp. Marseille-P3800]
MKGITTHILDLSKGAPAQGVRIKLYRILDDDRQFIREAETNRDGRVDVPLIFEQELEEGEYELVYFIGAYFKHENKATFFSNIPVRFVVTSRNEHYHVPLLLSPWGYQIYRGS